MIRTQLLIILLTKFQREISKGHDDVLTTFCSDILTKKRLIPLIKFNIAAHLIAMSFIFVNTKSDSLVHMYYVPLKVFLLY